MDRPPVVLRDERTELGVRKLSARINDAGDLVISGYDHGSGVERVLGSGTREYEWWHTVKAEDVPKLEAHLKGPVLERLAAKYSGKRADRLEKMLRRSGVPVNTTTWR